MKKIFKITALALTLAMAMVCFAGCGKTSNEETKQDTKQEAATPAPETGKVLKMGTNAAFPPYEYKEGDKFVGIDVDIAEALAKELGAKLEVVDMEFDSIIPAVDKGEVDFGMAGMTVNDERKEKVDFTSSYATGVQVVIVKDGSDIKDLDSLKGKKIGTQLGTTGDTYAKDGFGAENVVSYGKGADAVIALNGGDVDAVIIDNEPAKVFVEENTGLKILDTEYAVEDYAIAVKKGNTAFVDEINAALEKLTADGTIDNIIKKYIKAE